MLLCCLLMPHLHWFKKKTIKPTMMSFCVQWECVHSAFALWEVGMRSAGEFKQVNQCLNNLCKVTQVL